MEKLKLIEFAKTVVDKNKYAMLGTNSSKKYPNIFAMMKMENEGLEKFYFSTRETSRKVSQIKKGKKGCVYFYDADNYQSVMLEGTFKVVDNTTVPVAEIYKMDPHDPFEFCTIIFEKKYVNVYLNYETAKFELK